jgi:hypothetical protein
MNVLVIVLLYTLRDACGVQFGFGAGLCREHDRLSHRCNSWFFKKLATSFNLSDSRR